MFVVHPLDPNNPEHILPETEADILAETLNDSAPAVQSAPRTSLSTSRTHSGALPTSSSPGAGISGASDAKSPPITGLEDEDIELQRALQASIMAGYGEGAIYDEPSASGAGSSTRPSGSGIGGRAQGRSGSSFGLGYGGDRPSSGPPSRRTPPVGEHDFDDPPSPQFDAPPARSMSSSNRQTTPGANRQATPSANIQTRTATAGRDPVAASAARAKLRLEQMQREQAAAMNAMGGEGMGFGAGMAEAVDEEGARRRREAQERVRRAREEEEEQIRLAVAESLRSHGGEGPMNEEDMDEFVTPPTTTQGLPPTGIPTRSSSTAMPGAYSAQPADRHYDDEDAELQAALKASLEQSGAGLTIPSVPAAPVQASAATPASAPAPPTAAPNNDDEDDETDEEEEQTPAPTSPAVKAEVADPEEMRRRRLARFGG